MNRSRFIVTLAAILVLALGVGVLVGCGAQNQQQGATQTQTTAIPEGGGALLVKVNPEIAVIYDKDGKVVAVEGRNDEGRALITDDAEYVGKDCKTVVSALVAKIKKAGYIVEEVEGDGNNITIEVEDGSRVPSENFLSGVVAGVYTYTNGQKVKAKVNVEGESRYGWSEYGDSDYGPDNDGVTDYDDTPAKKSTAKKPASNNTNYDDRGTTNYGGNTNYDDGGTTNYNNSAYGSSNKKPSGSSSSSKPSRPSNNSNYDDGGTTNNGNSNYNDNTNYGGGNSSHGNSNYDDGGNTGYDKDDDDD